MDDQPSVPSTPPAITPKRKGLLAGSCGLVVLGGRRSWRHGLAVFFACRPVGRGPAGPAVPREAFAKTWTTRKVLLLGLGDSVTAGYGVPASYSDFGRLAKHARRRVRGPARGLPLKPCCRTCGSRTWQSPTARRRCTWRRSAKGLEKQDADIFGLVVITSGGNDLMHSRGRRPPCEAAMYGAP